jgi:hypothetical protein
MELGIHAAYQWSDTVMCAQEYDAVQMITEEMVSRVEQMKAYDFGFTPDFRAKMIAELRRNIGKRVLITTHFSKQERFMELVGLLNEGRTLEEAQKILTAEMEVLK